MSALTDRIRTKYKIERWTFKTSKRPYKELDILNLCRVIDELELIVTYDGPITYSDIQEVKKLLK